jgi:hypothetical protein
MHLHKLPKVNEKDDANYPSPSSSSEGIKEPDF